MRQKGGSVTLSSRSTRRLLAGVAAAALLARPAAAGEAEGRPAPFCGIVRVGGVPVPGATLVVRGVTAGGANVVKLLKSDADGMVLLSDAAEGLCEVLS